MAAGARGSERWKRLTRRRRPPIFDAASKEDEIKIHSRRQFSTVLLAAAVGLLGGCAAASRNTLLDGDEKSFVIVGYSTSYAWPAMLQDMLDEHAGGRRIYHVLNAVVGGSPVE